MMNSISVEQGFFETSVSDYPVTQRDSRRTKSFIRNRVRIVT